MGLKKLASVGSGLLRLSCQTFGFILVFAAFASLAQAGAPPPADAPEIDPGSLGSALALLSGGTLLLTSRLRRK
jgi:hypothetical protein